MLKLLKFLFGIDSKKVLSKKSIQLIEDLIDHRIRHQDIFIEALTHRSVLDNKKFKKSNERLEFLGDAVLGMVTGEFLFNTFPNTNEGALTKMRANLVNKQSLYRVGQRIQLFDLLFISPELIASESFGMKTVLADGVEAFIGAMYIDGGMEVAEQFIRKYILEPSLSEGAHLQDDNFKSQLLELLQGMKIEMPRYAVIEESGPEHDRVFTVAVMVNQRIIGEGRGKSKKAAEQDAAKNALKIITSQKDILYTNSSSAG